MAEKKVLYERLGGEAAVTAVVDIFYKKILSDDRTKALFQNTDMDKLRDHQVKFLTVAFGGPNSYTGKSMKEAHAKANNGKFPTDAQFGVVAELLVASLKEAGVGQADIDDVVKVALSVKKDVLGKSGMCGCLG